MNILNFLNLTDSVKDLGLLATLIIALFIFMIYLYKDNVTQSKKSLIIMEKALNNQNENNKKQYEFSNRRVQEQFDRTIENMKNITTTISKLNDNLTQNTIKTLEVKMELKNLQKK